MPFKNPTLANWYQPDPANAATGRISRIVGPHKMTGPDWAREVLSVELGPHVPEHVSDLFAVARGAFGVRLVRSQMFLLGEDQLHRVLDTAVKTRYAELGGHGGLQRSGSAGWLENVAEISDQKAPLSGVF